jgi:hypothetical protein
MFSFRSWRLDEGHRPINKFNKIVSESSALKINKLNQADT